MHSRTAQSNLFADEIAISNSSPTGTQATRLKVGAAVWVTSPMYTA